MKSTRLSVLTVGLAAFAMFFGAGNVIFPLSLGVSSGDYIDIALIGFVIMGVGIPFAGLFAMVLLEGDYWRFFMRLGKIPAFAIVTFIMAIIGPFVAMPRCILVSYATLKPFVGAGEWHLIIFSVVSSILLYLLTFRRSQIMNLLGRVLSPVMLISMSIMVIVGLVTMQPLMPPVADKAEILYQSVSVGYYTMDLLGAFFFCAVIVSGLKNSIEVEDKKHLLRLSLTACCIGAGLLALSYIGFSVASAGHAQALKNVSVDKLIGALAVLTLGKYAALLVCVSVTFACLTTAIALATVVSQYLQVHIFRNKVSYRPCLFIVILLTCVVSNLGFAGIMSYAGPILKIIYPGLIMLTFLNIAHELCGFRYVKTPVLIVVLLAAIHAFY